MKQKEINNLRKAIDLAEKPGGCKYVRNGKPCCVIAQLAVLEGIPVEQISKWDVSKFPGIGSLLLEPLVNGASAITSKYPIILLNNLQGVWDTALDTALEAARRDYNYISYEDKLELGKQARIRMHGIVSKELEKPEHHSF